MRAGAEVWEEGRGDGSIGGGGLPPTAAATAAPGVGAHAGRERGERGERGANDSTRGGEGGVRGLRITTVGERAMERVKETKIWIDISPE